MGKIKKFCSFFLYSFFYADRLHRYVISLHRKLIKQLNYANMGLLDFLLFGSMMSNSHRRNNHTSSSSSGRSYEYGYCDGYEDGYEDRDVVDREECDCSYHESYEEDHHDDYSSCHDDNDCFGHEDCDCCDDW